MTDVIATSQIEPILDDFLGVDCPHYEELRKRCAQRIVDLYANSCPASEWRDISTAPRDGMNIDVFCRDGERVTNVYWRNGRWMRFWVNDFETLDHVKLESEPTHWMPLPAPPQRNEVKT